MASSQVSASIHKRYYEIVSYIRPLMLAMDNNLRCRFTPIMTYLQATVYSMSEPVAIGEIDAIVWHYQLYARRETRIQSGPGAAPGRSAGLVGTVQAGSYTAHD
ncbi:hypothetical protein RIB2604_03700430 [Aspergillus luchuensis]|uniref:Uncharacterized protein n=1 Tax=Aspergillus kawachii TaxID=1069201 RepID=A0A146FZF7_ASPKA|nr:hypothetical protein RIB2604_03700430 [Aspergillus luchuensis]